MTTSGIATYKPGELVLVAFPFSDKSQTKVRPVVIVSIESYNRYAGDVVVCGVTSNLKPARFAIQIDQSNLSSGLLKAPSKIKVDAISAVEKSIIIKSIGRLNKATLDKVKALLRSLFGL